MPQTQTITVNQSWQLFRDHLAIDGETFTFKNDGPSEVFVNERVTEPPAGDTGFSYPVHQGGWGKLQGASFWVRCKEDNGATFNYQQFIA